VDMVEAMAVVMTMAMVDQLQSVIKKTWQELETLNNQTLRPALDATEATENSTSPN
jgi:hypothetical protein